MVASVMDEAIRRIIAAGGKLPSKDNVFYGLDNFCWNISSLTSEDGEFKLAQLVRANKALSDYCKAFGVPCISGKDSMKNVWRTQTTVNGKKVEKLVSVPPTLLFSARAKMEDISKAVTMDVKKEGEIVYIIGETYDELGASEYFSYMGEKLNERKTGNAIPKVDAAKAQKIYSALSNATEKGLVSSIHTPTLGGLGIALAQSAFAGGYGMEIDLRKVPYQGQAREDYILFSQSNSRFVATILPENQKAFEKTMGQNVFAKIGVVTVDKSLKIYGLKGERIINSDINSLKSAWKKTLDGI
jgi:phosphoribosylformylglycinamidine synthase